MKEQIIKLLDEQGAVDELVASMAQAKTDEEVLNIAHKIIAKQTEYGWLKQKINELFRA